MPSTAYLYPCHYRKDYMECPICATSLPLATPHQLIANERICSTCKTLLHVPVLEINYVLQHLDERIHALETEAEIKDA